MSQVIPLNGMIISQYENGVKVSELSYSDGPKCDAVRDALAVSVEAGNLADKAWINFKETAA